MNKSSKHDTCKDICNKIQKEGIKPIPKWHFTLKKFSLWTVFAISIILGSFAFGIILFQVQNVEWDIANKFPSTRIPFYIAAIPYFWIAILITLVTIAFIDLKKTQQGYKYKNFAIIGSSILASTIIGSIIFASGASQKIERELIKSPYYNRIHILRENLWARPENGLLSGIIKEIPEPNTIILLDPKMNIWSVDTSDCHMKIQSPPQTNIRIKVTGEIIKKGQFKAEEIRPWFKTDRPQIDRPPREL